MALDKLNPESLVPIRAEIIKSAIDGEPDCVAAGAYQLTLSHGLLGTAEPSEVAARFDGKVLEDKADGETNAKTDNDAWHERLLRDLVSRVFDSVVPTPPAAARLDLAKFKNW